jgi:hypothetical protein
MVLLKVLSLAAAFVAEYASLSQSRQTTLTGHLVARRAVRSKYLRDDIHCMVGYASACFMCDEVALLLMYKRVIV